MRSKPELTRIPVERWHCTAAMARSIGIPGSLEGAGAALGLKAQKDKEGHKLMLKLSKPKRPSKSDPSTRHTDPELIRRLAEYCVRDVDAETELFLKLPSLHPKERRFWVLNQKMNLRGFPVDRKLAKGALKLIAYETAKFEKQMHAITSGAVNSARQRDAVLKYMRREGMVLPNLRAQTVREALERGEFPTERAKTILEIRDAIGRSSTAKYRAFEIRSRHDGRARDNTVFFGAHTGRDAGAGLQPQNLFKRVMGQDEVNLGLELMRREDRHAIEALFEKPMDLYASALRGCIIASPEHVLEVGDFATIEVRVLFWLAGHQKGLDALASGRDLYCEMAGRIFRCDPEKIRKLYKAEDTDGIFKRQLGKQTVLGGGFGIGVNGEKFQATCKQYDMDIEIELAKRAVRAYREEHPRIPVFWTNIERAAVMACQNPGKRYKLGFLIWERQGDFLTCTLPIGRKLSYYKPKLELVRTPYGDKPRLSYLGLRSPSKTFGRISTWGGKLTENCVQAIARDLLYEVLLRLEESGKRAPVLAVHDEIVAERKKEACSLSEFINTMAKAPEWAKGLPVKVEGWCEERYRK
jgi:DNA polymerase